MKAPILVTMLFKFIKWPVLITLTALFSAMIGLHLHKMHIKVKTSISSPIGISSLEKIILGGQEQWIFVRGMDQTNPVLLFLHGGTGEPALGISSARHTDKELIKHFTVVHWDQLGAGKSYHKKIPASSMSMDNWLADCNELIDHLRARFNTRKIVLVAHSGGTILGLKIAQLYPDKIEAYVGISQIVNSFKQLSISYDWVVQEAKLKGTSNTQNKIKAIGFPPYDTPEKEYKTARFIIQYGGFIHNNPMKGLSFIVTKYLSSPEYSLTDGINTLLGKGLKFTMNTRYEEIKHIDFTREISTISTPVYFLQGKYDMITPTSLIEQYYQRLNAENGKELIIFENSAHNPSMEENSLYQDILIHRLKEDFHLDESKSSLLVH